MERQESEREREREREIGFLVAGPTRTCREERGRTRDDSHAQPKDKTDQER